MVSRSADSGERSRDGAAGVPDPAVLDLEHLGKYTASDDTLRGELLALFSEQLAQQISALAGHCEPDDWALATHTLKGAARAVGAWKIAETAEQLEQLDSASDGRECHDLVDRLKQQAGECRAAIAQLAPAA